MFQAATPLHLADHYACCRADQVVAANQSHVPPIGRGSLYLRPLLLGTGPILGLGAPARLLSVMTTTRH